MANPFNAVVTGGGSGLGRALCLDVARRGGRVIVSDIDDVGAAETARQVAQAGAEAHVVRCDVSQADEVDALAEKARELLGDIDLIANNAGVAVSDRFEDINLEDWHWIININLWGVIHGCRSFLPAMKARGQGAILNVASMAGLLSFPEASPYNATKAAVVALSETLHGECHKHGVNVSVLCPTFFETKIAEHGRIRNPKARDSATRAMRKARVQAPEVARNAIDGALSGQLYVLPMRDGRVMWRLQRFAPERFYRWLSGRLNPTALFD